MQEHVAFNIQSNTISFIFSLCKQVRCCLLIEIDPINDVQRCSTISERRLSPTNVPMYRQCRKVDATTWFNVYLE